MDFRAFRFLLYMKGIFKFLLLCCKDSEVLNKESQIKNVVGKEDVGESRDNFNGLCFEHPDKEKNIDVEGNKRIEKQLLKVRKNKPSIILSMDGSEHKIILIKGQTTI